MWHYSWLVCVSMAVSVSAISIRSNQDYDYSISASKQLAYYHQSPLQQGGGNGYQYEPPAAAQQLHTPAQHFIGRTHRQQTQQQQFVSSIARQFAAPALENAAFTTALTNQGYVFGNAGSARSAAGTLPAASARASGPASGSVGVAASFEPDNSVNVQLPLPLGITPVKLGPLPLQGGAPFETVPRGLTSYGTPYPQRR